MPMQFLPEYSPGAPGGVCFVCKSSRRPLDTVVDFFVDPEGLGWTVPSSIPGMAFELASGSLEICSTCIEEAARGLGMASSDAIQRLSDKIDHLDTQLAAAQARADAAETALRGLLEYRAQVEEVGNKVFGPEKK